MNAMIPAAITWSGAAWLAGLAAVALPILAHLWSRAVGPPAWFPSLRLLRQAQVDLTRRTPLRDLGLLIVRCLIVVLVALAFARPAWTRPAPGPPPPPVSSAGRLVGLVLDASASMTRTVGGVSLFDRARQQIARQLDSLDPAKDRAMLILGDDRPAGLLPVPTANFPALRRHLADAQPRLCFTDLAAAIRAVPGNAELHVFTDAQAVSLRGRIDRPVTWHRLAQTLDPANLALRRVRLDPAEPVAGLPCRLSVDLANFSDRPARTTVQMTGALAAATTVDLPAGQTTTATVSLLFRQPGPARLTIALPADRFEYDDRLDLVVRVRPAINVLLLTDGDPDNPQRFAYYLARAVQPGATSPFRLRIEHQWEPLSDPPRPDVVVLAQPSSPTADQRDRLNRLVRTGLGLVQFCQTGAALYLGPDHPPLTCAPPASTGPLHLQNSSLDRLLFSVFSGESRQTLLDGQCPAVATVPASNAHVLARWNNDRPALLELQHGPTRNLIWTGLLDPGQSDFVRSPAFAPLIHQMIRRALPAGIGPAIITAGQPARLVLPGRWAIDDLAVRTPTGGSVPLQVQTLQNTTPVQWNHTEELGLYRVADAHGELISGLTVKLDDRESDLRPAETLAQIAPVDQPYPPELFAPAAPPAKLSVTPLWPWCLAAALLWGVVEVVLAMTAQQQHPDTPARADLTARPTNGSLKDTP